MGVIPNTRLGKIEFYEAHITPWTSNAVATQAFHDKVCAMHSGPGAGSDMIETIKT